MTVNLEIATMVSAIMWPIVTLVILLIFRKHMPDLIKGMFKNVKKIDFAGISIERFEAESYTPKWSVNQLDLSDQLAEDMGTYTSSVNSMSDQLFSKGNSDYTIINLGDGRKWLTSRLFIMSIIFARQKGIRSIVFVEADQTNQQRFAGWTTPASIRWALAKKYPWLEDAYADAYAAVIKEADESVSSNVGELGSGEPFVLLLRKFLHLIQKAGKTPGLKSNPEWVDIKSLQNTFEHAHWIDGVMLEELLGDDLHVSLLQSNNVKKLKLDNANFQTILESPGEYIAITSINGRFQGLLNRTKLLEQAVQQFIQHTN
ncbi:hypothetical protein [Paenibacillus lignilyticus]|uniref:CBS domain-containing protein n=1 Tax=Paenibacillus lignilyticus TaxID=1172615 RepID=A0ABS5CBC8_9BACL|nr:hypothetical protein [Paenibacillus lignilyticus]MBP3963135.1 hypothetical protein [Paenibacillus lignilyticus]